MNESLRGTSADLVLPQLPGFAVQAGVLHGGKGLEQMTLDPSREGPVATST